MRNRGYPRRSGYEREENEWYVEPRSCVHQILDQLADEGRPMEGEVLDPTCGGGTIVSVCLQHGLVAKGSDHVDRGFGEVRDLRTITEPLDNVIANFPFSKAEEFIRHLLPLVRGRMLLILPLTFQESGKRIWGLHRELPARFCYPCALRPSMPPGVPDCPRDHYGALIQPVNRGGTAPFAWFEYHPGYRGDTIIKLFNPRKQAA
jgi:hypothetical protein